MENDILEQNKIISHRIYKLLKENHISQKEFANQIGMNYVYVNHILTGRKKINIELIIGLSQCIKNIDFNKIFGDLSQ